MELNDDTTNKEDASKENPVMQPDNVVNNVSDPVEKKTNSITAIVGIFTTILTIFIVLAYFLYTNQSTELIKAKFMANLSYVSGTVELIDYQSKYSIIQTDSDLSEGDIVRVSGVGRAVITLDDGSAIRLSDNSSVKLISLDPNNILIENLDGEVYTRVVKADRPFIVLVDGEKYQSMGTAYKTVNTDTKNGVLVYESRVRVESSGIEVDQGNKYFKINETEKDLVGKVSGLAESEISNDLFTQWNKEQDLAVEEFKDKMGVLMTKDASNGLPLVEVAEPEQTNVEQKPASKPIVKPQISLTGSKSDSGINLYWSTAGIDASKGYKIVRSLSKNPTYPSNESTYISSGSTKSYKWTVKDGKTYYFRVCQYTGDGCINYSNNLELTAPLVESTEATSSVKSINLAGSGEDVWWTVDGLSSKGFKVVYSKNSGPTYPNRTGDRYQYLSSPTELQTMIEPLDGPGTYYVRVCEYLGGSCGKYSNEITIEL